MQQSLKFYMTNLAASFKIIETKWISFSLIAGLIYLYHLIWTMYGVNQFSSQSREITCGSATTKEDASAVYDTAIALVTIFHMIDWIRWTLFITTAMVGANLLSLFYFLTVINLPFGIIAMLIGIVTRYGEDGTLCAAEAAQPERGFYLGL
jgi:hypothetical protein